VTAARAGTTDQDWADARAIWDYHQMHHPARPCSAGIGLGSHDLGVATLAADLYHAGLFPVLVFTGANSPTTATQFPRGKPSTSPSTPPHSASPPPLSSSNPRQPTPARTSSSPAAPWPPPGSRSRRG
jgi:hypothetical protein